MPISANRPRVAGSRQRGGALAGTTGRRGRGGVPAGGVSATQASGPLAGSNACGSALLTADAGYGTTLDMTDSGLARAITAWRRP
jgi:hypothetical protein